MKKIESLSVISIFTFVFVVSFITSVEKIVTFSSLFFLIILLIFYKDLNKNISNSLQKFIENFSRFPTFILLIILFIVLIIGQNRYLDYEIITWDVASYLVASSEISSGNIPLETQWESKGPLLMYIYFFLDWIVNGDYVKFRILNDLVLFSTSLMIYLIVYKETEGEKIKSFIGSLLFIVTTSIVWYISEFSEIYCLLFLSISIYVYNNFQNRALSNFIIGLLVSISSLINLASALFMLPFLVSNIYKFGFIGSLKTNIQKSLGFFMPHLLFLIIYYQKSLLDVYIANLITIPIGYNSEQSLSSIYELRVWSREIYNFNIFLYFAILTLIICFLVKNLKNLKHIFSNVYVLSLVLSVVIYFIGGHNYYHHLFYLVFFIPFLLTRVHNKKYIILIYIFIFSSGFITVKDSFDQSSKNLLSINELLVNYPLYEIAQEIESNYQDDYSIFALDYLMILNYLDKTNYSYIVHPMNHFSDFITDTLIDLEKIEENNIIKLINERPDVFICNTSLIINGIPEKLEVDFLCDIKVLGNDYYQLDTTKYEGNKKLNFYFDPYRELKVFIKK